MTAPERIWTWWFSPKLRDDVMQGGWDDKPEDGCTEYTRADLLTAAQAEIARLRAALEYYADRNEEGYEIWITDYGGWTGYSMENGPIIDDAGAIARAALDGTQDEVTK